MSDTTRKDDQLPEDAEELAASLADTAPRIQLHRREGGVLVYGRTLSTAEFSLEFVSEEFGGGEYQARFMGDGNRIVRAVPFRIGGPPKPFRREEDDRGAGKAEEAPPWARAIADRLDRLEREGSRGGGESSRFLELATSIATAMNNSTSTLLVPLLEAVSRRDKPQGSGELLDTVRGVLELSKDLGGGGAGGGDDALFRSLGVPILQTLQGLATREGATFPEGVPSTHHLQPPPPRTMPNPDASHPLPHWVRLIEPHVPHLVQLGAFRADVAHFGERLLDLLPEAHVEVLAEQLDRGQDFVRDLLDYFPDLVEHRAWLRDFFQEVHDLLQEGAEEEEDPSLDGEPSDV